MRGKSIMLTLQWRGCILLLFRSKFLVVLLCLLSNNTLEKQGTAVLSSLAHLPTYNIHNHPVYFHINKAHPFKLGCEFNRGRFICNIPPLFVKKKKTYSHCQPLPARYFLLYLIHVWHIFPRGCRCPETLKQKQCELWLCSGTALMEVRWWCKCATDLGGLIHENGSQSYLIFGLFCSWNSIKIQAVT